ncbi:MAG: hypothetical protein QOH25_1483 [Acidobacteriota bacterium]|jgi:hypothetical protein|nr:hypothetical protein [Acidobacteriota bacterium]
MSDKVFALLTVISSGIFGLAVAMVTSRLSTRREDRTFKRQLIRERIEATRALYEDALSALETLYVQRGRGSKDEQASLTRLLARLALRSTDEIRTQFDIATQATLEWAAQYSQTEPEEMSGMLFVKSGTDKYRKEAEKLYPIFHENFFKIKTMMVEHLKELENQV